MSRTVTGSTCTKTTHCTVRTYWDVVIDNEAVLTPNTKLKSVASGCTRLTPHPKKDRKPARPQRPFRYGSERKNSFLCQESILGRRQIHCPFPVRNEIETYGVRCYSVPICIVMCITQLNKSKDLSMAIMSVNKRVSKNT